MVRVWGRLFTVIVLGAGALAACGSDDSKSSAGGTGGSGGASNATGGASGSSKRLDQLTTDERKALCDSVAAKLGGYGTSKDCGGGLSLDAPADQAECLMDYTYTNCPVTVAEAEKCVNEQNCTTLIPASCAGLFSCTM